MMGACCDGVAATVLLSALLLSALLLPSLLCRWLRCAEAAGAVMVSLPAG